MIDRLVEGLRTFLFELRPMELGRQGLLVALRISLDLLKLETGTEYWLDSHLDQEPPPEVGAILYHICQEALANVREHAVASTVEVRIESLREGILVRIADDGVGFTDTPERPDRIGLTQMRERADVAGGWFRIESARGSGTIVEFWIPVTT